MRLIISVVTSTGQSLGAPSSISLSLNEGDMFQQVCTYSLKNKDFFANHIIFFAELMRIVGRNDASHNKCRGGPRAAG